MALITCIAWVQVLRACAPPLTPDVAWLLLSCVQRCLPAVHTSPAVGGSAAELLVSLAELVAALPPRKLLLHPQVGRQWGEAWCR